jgi:hypothetical protein
MGTLKRFGKALFGSKKAVAALVGFVMNLAAPFARKHGLEGVLTPDAVTSATAMLGTYMLGQGIADHGKEKAKVEAELKRTLDKLGRLGE